MKLFRLSIFFLLLSQFSISQNIFPPDAVKKKLEAVRIEGNLKIGGKLDEPEWLLARPVNDFIQIDPNQGEPAKKKTVVKLLVNKNYLYVSAVCYDTVGKNKFRVLNLHRDFVASNSDFFAVAIDGYNDEKKLCNVWYEPIWGSKRSAFF